MVGIIQVAVDSGRSAVDDYPPATTFLYYQWAKCGYSAYPLLDGRKMKGFEKYLIDLLYNLP